MSTVRFSYPAEFLDELELDGPNRIARNLLRLSYRHQRTAHGTQKVTAIATYKVEGADIVRLEHYLGEMWGNEFASDEKIQAVAKEFEDRLRKTARALGLTIRSGILE